jgi:hypothetical protein
VGGNALAGIAASGSGHRECGAGDRNGFAKRFDGSVGESILISISFFNKDGLRALKDFSYILHRIVVTLNGFASIGYLDLSLPVFKKREGHRGNGGYDHNQNSF